MMTYGLSADICMTPIFAAQRTTAAVQFYRAAAARSLCGARCAVTVRSSYAVTAVLGVYVSVSTKWRSSRLGLCRGLESCIYV